MLGWELPPHNSGGLGVACLNMAHALAREGANIEFVVPYEAEHDNIDYMDVVSATDIDPIFRYGGGAYESNGVEAKIIDSKNHPEKMSIRDIQSLYCDFIENKLMDFKPDVIHAHDWLTYEAGILAKKRFHAPLIAHVHATEFDRAGMKPGNKLIHEIEYEGLMMADEIIAVSESTKRLIHDKYHIPLNKISVAYNSLDEDFINHEYKYDHVFKYIDSMKAAGYTVISTVGRFTIQKGLKFMMNAAKRALDENPKLLFVFAGDGEEFPGLVEQAASLGISKNVLFTGFIRGKKLRDVYAVSDIFVMSSVSEPFGLTALEAARHGDALILTNQSGVSEVIWSAMKYDYWDEMKLADEILAIASSPALGKSLRANASEEYQKMSWDQVAKKCMKIYNKSIKHKR